MKRFLSILLTIIAIISLSITVFASENYSQKTDDVLRAYLTANGYHSIQDLADSFCENVASGEEWFVIAFRKLYGNQVNFDGYSDALTAYVREKNPSVATTKQLISLAFQAIGVNDYYVSETLNDSVGNNGLMSYVFGLHLYNNLGDCIEKVDDIIQELLVRQLPDGGWAVIGNTGDPDVTAMTIQALSPYYHDRIAVNEAVNNALALLSAQQLDNGGFVSMGKENPESPAQVLIALSSLGMDALDEPAFIKNGNTLFDAIEMFQTLDHRYSHTIDGDPNDSATRQVFLGYASYCLMVGNGTSLYSFSQEFEPLFNLPVDMNARNSGILGKNSVISGKTFPLIIVLVAAIISCLVLIIKGKRNYKSYLFVFITAIVICVLILTVDITKPEDYYGTSSEIEGNAISTVITIRCDSVAGEKDYIPADGVLLQEFEIQIPENASVLDQLVEACKQNSIQLECKTNGYVSGMNYLYEFDFGELSGWLFMLNNQLSSVGASEVDLSEGDQVEWVYTLNLGKDIADSNILD